MITPETLPHHELAGLHVRVAAASNPALIGIEGRVVDETTQTLVIKASGEGSGAFGTKQVPKDTATFEFRLPDGDNATYVTVEGEVLVERPARRTERRGDSTWH